MQYYKVNIVGSGVHYRSGATLSALKAHLKSKGFNLTGATFTQLTLAQFTAAIGGPMPKATFVNGKIVFK